MNKKQKKILKQTSDIMFEGDIEEILERKISSFGSGSHIVLPKKHRGKKVRVAVYKY
ncbi:MAG: DUF2080 family transposase-associated protein [archaeon]